MTGPAASRRRVLIVEPAAAASNVFSAFGGLPLLGPMYMGTVLKEAGFEVTVVSENLLGRRLGAADLTHDFLLLSCLTPTVERGYELATQYRASNRAGRVIMGGPHVSFLPEEALAYAHHVVVGEAEDVIVDLLRHGSDERIVHGKPVACLDTLPFVDWELLRGWERQRIQPLMFSRGCPFGCNFCSVTAMFGRKYRAVSVERALEEIHRSSRSQAFIYDDNFTASRSRSYALLEAMARTSLRPSAWSAQVRTDLCRDEELVALLRRAGCGRVYIGLESINDLALAEMNKGQTLDDVRHAIRALHRQGIAVHGMFMFGADADRPDTLRATGEFVRSERIDSVQYMISTPFPGTEYYRRLAAEGRILHRQWRYFDAMHVVFRPRQLSPHALQQLTMREYDDYYTLPRALKDGGETAWARLTKLVGGRPRQSAAHTLTNAALKVMGGRIVRKFRQANRDYFRYLRSA